MPKLRKKSSLMKEREARDKRRSRIMDLSGDERVRRLARHAEYQRERRARLSPTSLAELRNANAARNRRRRAAMTHDQLEEERKINRERARRRRDGIRTGSLSDSVASPDLFSSVGLRKQQESTSDTAETSPEVSSSTSKKRSHKRPPRDSNNIKTPEDLLSSVTVELTEGPENSINADETSETENEDTA